LSARPFSSFEVHLVGAFSDAGTVESWMETIDTAAELEDLDTSVVRLFYTVYGYRDWGDDRLNPLPDGGAEAIADFDTYQPAIDLATALADGKTIVDMAVDREVGL